MIDLYLKFESEAQAEDILYTEVPVEFNEDGDVVSSNKKPNYVNIDVLGIMYEEQDDPSVEPNELSGWHVNVRVVDGEDETPLLPYSVQPTLPRRVWG
jgi:hypothetical protein